MRKISIVACAIFLSTSFQSTAQDDLINKVKDNGGDTKEFVFETVLDLETTPVKNQGRSGTCWSYATTSFVESEMLRMGKEPVDLSEMFTVRQVYLDKAEKYVRLHGYLNFAQGGALPDVMYVLKKYGAVPQEVYEGLDYGTDINNHSELEGVLKAYLDVVIKNPNGTLSTSWRKGLISILDSYLGEYPEEFEYNGVKYSPRSFADKIVGVNPDDYVQLTSFTHFNMYDEVMIQVPDNWAWGTAYNVSIEEMVDATKNSLQEGYSVAWATDVSEKGFSLKNGIAIVPANDYSDMSAEEKADMFNGPKAEKEITAELRQEGYDNYSTTDDHGMQITGIVKDQSGTEYFIVKNSWGERGVAEKIGYIYASQSFFEYKTLGVLIHKDVLSNSLRKKLGL